MTDASPHKLQLHWQIAAALALAALAGSLISAETQIAGVSVVAVLDFFGKLFLNALKMIVVPLIIASIIVGVCRIANDHAFGRLGGKTLGYYLMTSSISIIVGLFFVNLFAPGLSDGEPIEGLFTMMAEPTEFMHKVEGKSTADIAEVILRMVPPNVFEAAAQGQLLGLIFFSAVFGFFAAKIPAAYGTALLNFWHGVQEVMILITLWIMKFAPYGVFALVAETIILTGFEAVEPLLKFFFTVIAALGFHFLIVLPVLLRFVAGVSPLRYAACIAPALLTAFSTASSSATLPVSLNSAQQRAGISKRISSFVLPLGATVNMDGTALYECVVVIFVAQLYGIDLTAATQITIVLLALLTSIGVAGIPAASLVAITLILSAVGLPIEAIGLILAVDRILDMCRTAVNVSSDLTGTCLIARSEKEKFL